ncbi:MAG: ABC transporter permease [Actinobacteria bacterium]|nr:ABC transporter permease [Actinomycetota bacterium]
MSGDEIEEVDEAEGRRSIGEILREQVVAAGRALIFPAVALAIALLVGVVVILITGNSVIEAYAALLRGGFGSRQALGRTISNATPLIFTGLAVAIPFRGGLFNIGGEGQLFIGAIAGVWIGLTMPGPGPLVAFVAIIVAGLAGWIWGAIPGLLKIWGAHEVITTIMLNFIGINLTFWLAKNPLSGEGAVPGTGFVPEGVRLTRLGGGLGAAHYGFVLGIVAAIVAYILIWRTTKGYELRTVGQAPGAARYAGMSVAANSFLAIALGGMFAGLGGGLESLGTFGKVSVPFISNLGFNGIGVALLGRNHPAGVVLGAIFFGGLAAGAQQMQFSTGVPLDLADVLLAIVLLFVTATKLVEYLLGRRARTFAAGTRLEKGLAG